MVLPVNGARGEVGITIGGADIVIAATMGGLAAVSTELGCKSMHDLYERLTNGEIAAVVSGIRHLTIEGDASSVISALKLKHFSDVSRAFAVALSHHFDGAPGNGQAGGSDIEADFPWRDWQRSAFGVLRWTPATFWTATLSEFLAAIDGFIEARGGKKHGDAPTDAQMDALLKQYGN